MKACFRVLCTSLRGYIIGFLEVLTGTSCKEEEEGVVYETEGRLEELMKEMRHGLAAGLKQ